jgi:hypothetical protein
VAIKATAVLTAAGWQLLTPEKCGTTPDDSYVVHSATGRIIQVGYFPGRDRAETAETALDKVLDYEWNS